MASDAINFQKGYATVNGLEMYYEIYGQGAPLVLVHGGGSTIQTTFGRIVPLLANTKQLVCVELQAHGRSGDRPTGISFEQDADDVAGLLTHLNIEEADIFGFSNGGNTALQMAIRHPQRCRKIIAASVLLKRSGALPAFWDFMENGTFEQMPQAYKDAFLNVNPDRSKLYTMYEKCASRMIHFIDFRDDQLMSIQSPVLFLNGDADVATPEHMAAMARLVPHSELAIFPGGHGEYMGEITTLKSGEPGLYAAMPLIERFLAESR